MAHLFDNASVLVTGGTGSFGKRFIKRTLEVSKARRVIIFSRDELKQFEMQSDPTFSEADRERLRFFIGDVRDRGRLSRAFDGVDYVVHAAALKQVPAAEYNPFEAVKTNVLGGQNVIDAAIERGVKRVVAMSTDKACNPVNLYGATKLCSDKLFVAGNSYAGSHRTRFSVVRYGNVVGSRGSVVPFFMKVRETGRLPITHPEMTRFWITLEQGVDFVLSCFDMMQGGELYVPKIPSAKILDLAKAIGPDCEVDIVGVRPGEKLHEVMISRDDSRQTVELPDRYILTPSFPWWDERAAQYPEATPVEEGFEYSSESNDEWLDVAAIKRLIAPFEPRAKA